MLTGWNGFLNNIHETGQLTGNQVQNLGAKVLTDTDIFEGRNNYPQLINREFRQLLGRALPYRERFDGFLDDISRSATDVIRILADCDRALEVDFTNVIEEDLIRARNC